MALLVAWPVLAGPVDAQRASEVARKFFQNDPVSGRRFSTIHRLERYGTPLTKAGDATPAFHIFSREGGGFVIVSGDDACKPILGYSFENDFGPVDQMPEGLRDWLADFEAQVVQVRQETARPEAVSAARSEWMAVEYPTKAGTNFKPEVLHDTPAWNQGDPFNRLCPVDGGKTSYVGCVPLAMSLVMNFFGYPAQGKGTLPSYDYELMGKSYHVDGHQLGYSYEWEKFRNVDFNKSFTDDQAKAAATFIRDVAMAGQAWFTATGTDCNFERIVPAVLEYFGYDPNVTHLRRWYFTDKEWMNMIKGDLQDHPLIYAANKEGGGHAFVVDGYDKKDNLHINWGWGPSYNGYFALSAFTPVEGSNYKYDHTTILGLVPDKGQGGQPDEYLYLTSSQGGKGLSCTETPERGKTFYMDVIWFFNGGLSNFDGKVCFALTDSEGNILERISDAGDIKELKPRGGLGLTGISCKINAYPMEGDKVRMVYRSNKWPEGVWKLPLYRLDEDVVEAIAVKADDTKLADVTSLNYNKSDATVSLKTMDRVNWTLKGSTGTVVGEGVSKDMALKIPAADLAKGSYTLTLTRGKDKQVVTLKMGNK